MGINADRDYLSRVKSLNMNVLIVSFIVLLRKGKMDLGGGLNRKTVF